ncbi:Gfo/Idh/MocA family oxidoreductase [Donghicola sp. C2-DW-16]|uniref:Gfo/Idh/MocA family oxidoreductase n=1 Tax=Donghicola mangrovi TaxID=2729614 RepID=A0ABX2PHL4_9RHOB|nr:Gfo/Idh/MocA family oxidoreductase [Donghicola mangrovi]NVO28589.1 Gfo/Idh/MocA family oxidoreductase [Donghicola mangrovi]
MARLPVCVIGGGSIGMRHAEVATKSELTKLTCVVEPHAPRRAELIQMGVNAVASIEDAPDDTRAAISATPTQLHHTSALQILDQSWAGIIEKPLTATVGEGLSLIAEARDKPLFCGHHRRCHPFSITARQMIEQLGDLVGVQALWSLRKHDTYYDTEWRTLPGAGVLMTNVSHEMDLLRFLVGDMTEVSALTSNARRGMVIEDTAALSLRFANGALGSVLMSDAGASPWAFEAATGENPTIARSGEDYLRIIGTMGALAFPSLTQWSRGDDGEIEWSKPMRRQFTQPAAPIDPLQAQIERFASVVGGAEDDILCTLADGHAALELTLAAVLSGRDGRPVRRGEVPHDFRGV